MATTDVFVGGLPEGLPAETIKQVFEGFGAIVHVKILSGNKPGTQCAILKFSNAEDAKWVVVNVNNNIPEGLQAPVVVRFGNKQGGAAGSPGLDGGSFGLTGGEAGGAVGVGVPLPGSGVARKTKLCQFWATNSCRKTSADCRFAHGEHEIGTARKLVPAEEMLGHGGLARKTKLCQFFESGQCQRGVDCPFAHGQQDLQQAQQSQGVAGGMVAMGGAVGMGDGMGGGVLAVTPAVGVDGGMGVGMDGGMGGMAGGLVGMGGAPAVGMDVSMGGVGSNPGMLTKTMLCQFFTSGQCHKGAACRFAHGQHELGMPVTKSKICQFFANGQCMNGAACRFAHGDHELGTPRPLVAEAQGIQVGMGNGGQAGSILPATNDIFISNLPEGIAFQTIHEVFSSYGTVVGVEIKSSDGQDPGGCATVTYQNIEDSQWVVENLNGNIPAGLPGPVLVRFNSGGMQAPDKGKGKGGMDNNKFSPYGGAGVASGISSMQQQAAVVQPITQPMTQQLTTTSTGGGKGGSGPPLPQNGLRNKLCGFYPQGLCKKGDMCPYAHGEEQLKTPIPVGAGTTVGLTTGLKNKLCGFFAQGTCRNGANCGYAHGEEELKTPIPAAIAISKGIAPNQAVAGSELAGGGDGPDSGGDVFVGELPSSTTLEQVRYIFEGYGKVADVKMLKKKPCQFFASGQCKNGDACKFSHGEDETGNPKTDTTCAIVKFQKYDDAKWTIDNINGNIPEGLEKPVTVRWGQHSKGGGKGSVDVNGLMQQMVGMLQQALGGTQ